MNNKYNLTQITKLLEKIFNAGYDTEKSIISMGLEDLEKIPELSSTDITILIDLKKAVKSKKILDFLKGNKEKKEGIKNV